MRWCGVASTNGIKRAQIYAQGVRDGKQDTLAELASVIMTTPRGESRYERVAAYINGEIDTRHPREAY